MREFERTGVYPEYLLFTLPGTRQSWRVKVKKKPQTGNLKRRDRNLSGISVIQSARHSAKLESKN